MYVIAQYRYGGSNDREEIRELHRNKKNNSIFSSFADTGLHLIGKKSVVVVVVREYIDDKTIKTNIAF